MHNSGGGIVHLSFSERSDQGNDGLNLRLGQPLGVEHDGRLMNLLAEEEVGAALVEVGQGEKHLGTGGAFAGFVAADDGGGNTKPVGNLLLRQTLVQPKTM